VLCLIQGLSEQGSIPYIDKNQRELATKRQCNKRQENTVLLLISQDSST